MPAAPRGGLGDDYLQLHGHIALAARSRRAWSGRRVPWASPMLPIVNMLWAAFCPGRPMCLARGHLRGKHAVDEPQHANAPDQHAARARPHGNPLETKSGQRRAREGESHAEEAEKTRVVGKQKSNGQGRSEDRSPATDGVKLRRGGREPPQASSPAVREPFCLGGPIVSAAGTERYESEKSDAPRGRIRHDLGRARPRIPPAQICPGRPLGGQ